MENFKFRTKREHIHAVVTVKSALKYGFHPREIELATEFLHFAYIYSKNPLKVEGHKFKSIFRMVKHRITLQKITANLDMSFSALRKYTEGLKQKGFFSRDGFNKDFKCVMDDSVVFDLVYGYNKT